MFIAKRLKCLSLSGGSAGVNRLTAVRCISTSRPTAASNSIFEEAAALETTSDEGKSEKTNTITKAIEHRYRTANFKASPQKLNLLANQIAGKSVEDAILQMQFSPKRPAKRILSTIALARDHAIRYKGMDESKLVVAQAWVGKGEYQRRLRIHARAKRGIMHHPQAHMALIIKERPDESEVLAKSKPKKKWTPLGAIDNKPIYRPSKFYNW